MATAREVLEALRQVKYPGFSRDIVSFGVVRDVEVGGLATTITIAPPADAPDLAEKIRAEVERVVAALPLTDADAVSPRRPAPFPCSPVPSSRFRSSPTG